MGLTSTTAVERIVAERMQVGVTAAIPEYLLKEFPMVAENAKLDWYVDRTAHSMVLHLRSFLLDSCKIDRREDHTVRFPSTPWQFFKEKYLPLWFISRYPVVYKSESFPVAIHNHYMCPHLSVPDQDPHIFWMHTGNLYDEYQSLPPGE